MRPTYRAQRCRNRYDHIGLPPIWPLVTRVELLGGRCGGCGRRYRTAALGTPFGTGIRSLLTYLHHSYHVGLERLSRLATEMFGLAISQYAIANMFQRLGASMATATDAIRKNLRTARIIASDETTTRTNGVTQWQWVFVSDADVLHKIAPRRAAPRRAAPRWARSVAETVLGDHRPDVWISDRYGGQQELGGSHQVCLAHVQYTIDSGDTIFAAKVRDHLRWTIRVGRRRNRLRDTTLASYAAKADLKLSRLMRAPVAHPSSKVLMKQIKSWRTKFFVFLTNRDVLVTNNISEHEIRPSVMFRKITGSFRSE